MGRSKKELFANAEISVEFRNQIIAYIKDAKRSLTCSKQEKEFFIEKLQNSILVYAEENPKATIEDIKRDIGDASLVENDNFNSYVSEKPEKIKKRMSFQRIILVAAILMVTIVGIVYTSAFIENHLAATGWTETEVRIISEISE